VWALEQIKKGVIPTRADMTFGAYAKNWFVWDKCGYIKRKRAHGNSISHGYVESRRIHLKNNITPYFTSRRFVSLKPHDIETWLQKLRLKGLANGTINQLIGADKMSLFIGVRPGETSLQILFHCIYLFSIEELIQLSSQKYKSIGISMYWIAR
jgi:hypothetical protein